MCMIAHRAVNARGRGSNIPNEVIDTAITRHSDGFGIAWRDDLGLRYEKFGPSEAAAFRTLIKAVDKIRSIEYVAHWRMATQGPACRDLAHPYSYTDPEEGEVLVFHNGVIDIAAEKHESDTQVFVRDVLAKLPTRWWKDPAISELVDMSTSWSRIMLMTAVETVNLNYSSGTMDNGIWYSSNHKSEPTFKYQFKDDGWSKDYRLTDLSKDHNWRDKWEKLPDGSWARKSDAVQLITAHSVSGDTDRGGTTQPTANVAVWQHEGHIVNPLRSFDFTKDGDYENSITCDECGTVGDVYLVDGKAYTSIGHEWTPVDSADKDDEDYVALLPGPMEVLA